MCFCSRYKFGLGIDDFVLYLKKIIIMRTLFIIILLITIINFSSFSQNVGIGTNIPHPSAALDITDSTKGILIPRMTMNQRNAIQNPAEGLMVYQTDSTKGYWYYDGNEWKNVANTNSLNNKSNNNKTLIYTTSGF
jgi:hypothetical protein